MCGRQTQSIVYPFLPSFFPSPPIYWTLWRPPVRLRESAAPSSSISFCRTMLMERNIGKIYNRSTPVSPWCCDMSDQLHFGGVVCNRTMTFYGGVGVHPTEPTVNGVSRCKFFHTCIFFSSFFPTGGRGRRQLHLPRHRGRREQQRVGGGGGGGRKRCFLCGGAVCLLRDVSQAVRPTERATVPSPPPSLVMQMTLQFSSAITRFAASSSGDTGTAGPFEPQLGWPAHLDEKFDLMI